jgi:flagella basal body P-ring formation protein FlgA
MTSIRPLIATSVPLLLAGALACLSGWFSVSGAVELSQAQIQQKVVAHVQEKLQNQISKADQAFITVEVMNVPYPPLNFPQVKDVRDIKITPESSLGEMYSERTIVRVHMETPDGANRDMGVPVHITVKKPVWVVKNAISAQQLLRTSDFTLQTKDVSYIYRYAAGQETSLGDYISRINLQPGEVLDTRKILIPPDVTYNSEVRILISGNNGMTLTVPGVALANGRIGETIRVRQSVYQNKYYSAKVINKNQVLVEI